MQHRDNGEKRRLGLPGRSRRSEQHIFLGAEDCLARRDLDAAQRGPAAVIYEILYTRSITLKNVHRNTLAKTNHILYEIKS